MSRNDEKRAPDTPEIDEKKRDSVSAEAMSISSSKPSEDDELDPAMLQKAFRFAAWSSVILVCSAKAQLTLSDLEPNLQLVVMLLIIPLPLFFAQTVYGVRGLEAWVVIGMIWTFMSAFSVVLYPLWESRAALKLITRGMIKVRDKRSTNT